MTLADIKISALKLMFATYDDIVAANIADYYDDTNLSVYLNGMNESINRCMARFLDDEVAPEAIVEVEDYTTTEDDYYIYFDLTDITDFESLVRVIYTDGGYYEGNAEYIREGDTLWLPYRTGDYKLVYVKEMPYIDSTTVDTDTIDLPDKLLHLLPLWIKGELYEDDPNLAAVAMNTFEQRLMLIKKKKAHNQTSVDQVYGGSNYYDD